ncbi:hypothetical protein Patl1_21027 [Pistacia atlantica]|uniref:Uncharacterized protein n=1 Tax=Pistacia atlantica TaxID=434234 RepID=A0ACC1BHA3_9ROSI|nr:hypothetical protein Patl1_21027 [Pistacia atlantica]
MVNKQDDSSTSLPASSSRRANSPKNVRHLKTNVGCISGIFRFVYGYNNRRHGKFITSGKKQEKNSDSSSLEEEKKTANGPPRSSHSVPRSPTLPAEIRRSSSVKAPENLQTTPPSAVLTAESAADKRKESSVSTIADEENNNKNNDENFGGRDNKCLELNGELQPSPVSVLEDFMTTASLMSGYSRRYTNGRVMQQHMKLQKPKKKPGEDDEMSSICFLDRMRGESNQTIKSSSGDHQEKVTSPMWASKAMIESVNEVCKDIAWGEKREIGRIGLVLQDRICRDLIEEIVRELECFPMFSLPFEACKRSLRF